MLEDVVNRPHGDCENGCYHGDVSAGGWLMKVGGNPFGDLARVLERDRTRSANWEQTNPILN